MTLHDQIRNLEQRPNWAFGRPHYIRQDVGWAFVRHVEDILTSDPRRALPLSRTAIRHANRIGHKCLRVGAISVYAGSNRALGCLTRAEGCFRFAFDLADGCSCCLPDLNRKFAYVLTEKAQYREAQIRASRALALYQKRDDFEGLGKAYLCRGYVHDHAGHVDASIGDLRRACDIIQPSSGLYRIAFQSYTVALSHSDALSHVKEAVALVPDVRRRFVGLRDAFVERSKLDWMEGGVLARFAKLDPDLDYLQRYSRRSKARDLLADALDAFVAQGMPLEVAAVGADLAAVEAVLNATRGRVGVRLLLSNTLEKLRRVGGGASLQPIRRAMRDVIAATRELASTGPMWAALRKLRDLTVEAGCAPPLVPYLDPAAAL